MIRRFFSRLRPAARRPTIPSGLRVYAIGDVHGRSDLLERLHARIRHDGQEAATNTDKVVVYLGDYIDRGLDSRAVIDLLLDRPLGGYEAVHLKGNHEDSLLRFLDDASLGPDWFAIGGDATAISYGARIPKGLSSTERFEHVQAELRARIPERHLEFLRRLELMHQAGDYVFVHAGIRPGVALEQQEPEDLMWIRDEFLNAADSRGKLVVHGHSITESARPEIHDHRIGIDTGAYATNVLTCLVLEGADRRFISTEATAMQSGGFATGEEDLQAVKRGGDHDRDAQRDHRRLGKWGGDP